MDVQSDSAVLDPQSSSSSSRMIYPCSHLDNVELPSEAKFDSPDLQSIE